MLCKWERGRERRRILDGHLFNPVNLTKYWRVWRKSIETYLVICRARLEAVLINWVRHIEKLTLTLRWWRRLRPRDLQHSQPCRFWWRWRWRRSWWWNRAWNWSGSSTHRGRSHQTNIRVDVSSQDYTGGWFFWVNIVYSWSYVEALMQFWDII